jgi:hypothetical protein
MSTSIFALQIPSTEEGWLQIAQEFDEKWNFPHCLGALDGKHVILQAPVNSGSEYFNYKRQFSIVLFAVVNANYNFVYVDVGCQGRISDGGVFKNCTLHKTIEKGELNSPQPQCLDGRETEIPYFFLGDEAFALSQHLMKVFPGMYPTDSKERVFNYRVCRARRVVENVFGISSSVFRVLRKPLLLHPEKAALIVMAVAHLHNFLRRDKESINLYSPLGSFDYEVEGRLMPGSWRNDNNEKISSLLQLQRIPKRPPKRAMEIRKELADFFMKEGKIPWQNQYA